MNPPLSLSPAAPRAAGAMRYVARPPRTECVAGYRVEKWLGRGRNAVVVLALEPGSLRQVALKLARPGADLGREFGLQAMAAHPQVISVYAHGPSPEGEFIAMEYAAAGTLALQCGRPVAPARAFDLVRQAAAALAAVHAQGFVHRDVKPANFFLRDDASLALGDFGCACLQGAPQLQATGTVTGTPQYAAPEQSQGAAADPAADVYSLGVLLYELLTGLPPFPGGSLIEQISQHLIAPPPPLPPALRHWQPLLDQLLAKAPGHRPADGQAVLQALQGLAAQIHLPHATHGVAGTRTTP